MGKTNQGPHTLYRGGRQESFQRHDGHKEVSARRKLDARKMGRNGERGPGGWDPEQQAPEGLGEAALLWSPSVSTAVDPELPCGANPSISASPKFCFLIPMLILPVNLPGAKESLAGLRGNQKEFKSLETLDALNTLNGNLIPLCIC